MLFLWGCVWGGAGTSPITASVTLKEPVNHVEGSLSWRETAKDWKSGGLGFTIKLV